MIKLSIIAPPGYRDQFYSGENIPIPQIGSTVKCSTLSPGPYKVSSFTVIGVDYDYRDEIEVEVTLLAPSTKD